MNNQLVIRSYLKSDRKSCLDIFDKNCPSFFHPSERAGLETWLNGQDSGKITYESSMADFFYVILNNLEIAGCGGFYIVADKPVSRITWTIIDPSFQGKGLGKHLVSHCIKQIENLFPKHKVELDTSQHTYQFFETLDFVTSQITVDGYGTGLHRYDMVRASNKASR